MPTQSDQDPRSPVAIQRTSKRVAPVERPARKLRSHGDMLLASNPSDWRIMNDEGVHLRETFGPLVIMLAEIVGGYRAHDWKALDQWWRRFLDAIESVHRSMGMGQSKRAILRKTALLAYKAAWQSRFSEHQELKHLQDWSDWLEQCMFSHSLSVATLEIIYDFAQTLGPVDHRTEEIVADLQSVLEGASTVLPRRPHPSMMKTKWRKAPVVFSVLLFSSVLWMQYVTFQYFSISMEQDVITSVQSLTKVIADRPGI